MAVRCPNCAEEGLKSQLDQKRLVPINRGVHEFWDEDGLRHVHDSTTYRDMFTCSRGHNNLVEERSRCPQPVCDWNKTLHVSGRGPVRT